MFMSAESGLYFCFFNGKIDLTRYSSEEMREESREVYGETKENKKVAIGIL